jgi:ComF family protein
MDSSGSGDRRRRFRSLNNIAAAAADAAMAMAFAPGCASCAALLESPHSGPVCDACWRAVGPFALPWRGSAVGDALSAAPYDGPLRNIIHAWKFERRQSLVRPLGALVRERCAAVLDGADAAAPVPMTPWRQWRRGFNQADDLARRLGLPVVRPLARWRHRPAQASLHSDQRRRNLAGAMLVLRHRRASVRGRVIVLVDDVVTTGATLEACAAALQDAGAKDVRAVTVARTLKRVSTGECGKGTGERGKHG